MIRFSKTYPSFLTIKEGAFLKSSRPSLPLKKAPPLISVFSPQGRRGKPPSGAQNRYALRLADHQRSTPYFAGWDRLDTMLFMPNLKTYFIWIRGKQRQVKHVIIFSLTLLQIQRSLQRFWNHQTAGNTYRHKARETYCVYLPLLYLLKPPLCRLSAIRCIVPRS